MTDAALALSNGQWSYTLRDTCRQLERELADASKDYKCLAELLDGHDATECRANLVRMIERLKEITE